MDGFTVGAIDLSMLDPETGTPLVANVYQVEGIDRELSIAELVMAICLSRAAELEEKIVNKMEEMNQVTTKLESLTKVQAKLTELNDKTLGVIKPFSPEIICEWPGRDQPFKVNNSQGVIEFLNAAEVSVSSSTTLTDAIAKISGVQDSLNSINQRDMIDLQSMSNKRDQSYDMITYMTKSMGVVLMSTANNFGR